MLFATMLFFFQSAAAHAAAAPPSPPISRFQMIVGGVYRGGQPDRKGFEYLRKSGVKTVINMFRCFDHAF